MLYDVLNFKCFKSKHYYTSRYLVFTGWEVGFPTGASVLPKEAHLCLLILAVFNRGINLQKTKQRAFKGL